MKIKANITKEIFIDKEFICEYAYMESDVNEKPVININSSKKKIEEYFDKHKENILAYAKESLIDDMVDVCTTIATKADYSGIEIENIV